jgi:hypothetical protein
LEGVPSLSGGAAVVICGASFRVVGQAGEEAEVGGRAGLEGEGQHREEEDRGPRAARPWFGLRGMGVGRHGRRGSARGSGLSLLMDWGTG